MRPKVASSDLLVALVAAASCLGSLLLTTRLGDYTTDAGPRSVPSRREGSVRPQPSRS